MSRPIRLFSSSCALVIAALGPLAGPAAAAWPNNPAVNVPVCTAAGNQTNARACSDGAGGMIVAWEDRRSGTIPDIFAQRITAAGTAAWTMNGVALSSTGTQLNPVVLPDGSNGAYVAWNQSGEVYLTRVTGAGTIAAGWPAFGLLVSDGSVSAAGNRPSLVEDGAGGAFVVWESSAELAVTRITSAGALAAGWSSGGDYFGPASIPVAVSDGAGGLIAAFITFETDIDVSALRITGAAAIAAGWPAAGVELADGAGDDFFPVIASDGFGGAIVAWHNGVGPGGGGVANIFASRVTAAGVVPNSWNPLMGVLVCGAAGNQSFATIVEDNAGGAYISWMDPRAGVAGFQDVYVAHLSSAGPPAEGWPLADGIGVDVTATTVTGPALAADGSGGVFVAYDDSTAGARSMVTQRYVSGGTLPAGWPATGRVACNAASRQTTAQVIADRMGGALLYWQDHRDGATSDLYAQRVERFSRLGNPEPVIVGAVDVPNDQGGQVKLSWDASYLDADPLYEINNYRVLRSVPPQLVSEALAYGARVLSSPGEEGPPGKRAFLATTTSTATYYWELVATQSALQVSTYSYVTPTTGDGVSPPTAFMVQARNAAGNQWWYSEPVEGHSEDNLSPAMPMSFSAQYFTGTAPRRATSLTAASYTWLHWNPSTEPDFLEYRLHRGTTPDFAITPGNLVVAQEDTGYVDHAGAPYHYKLVAVDVHGNASVSANVTPSGTISVPEGIVAGIALGPVSPNPARDVADLRLSLPREAEVELAIFDAAGRQLHHAVQGRMAAGEHVLRWDARHARGERPRSGVYFAQIVIDGVGFQRRFVVVR